MQLGFTSALFLMLLFLQLGGWITWAWVWVFAPILIHLAIAIGLLSIIGLAVVFSKSKDNNGKKAFA